MALNERIIVYPVGFRIQFHRIHEKIIHRRDQYYLHIRLPYIGLMKKSVGSDIILFDQFCFEMLSGFFFYLKRQILLNELLVFLAIISMFHI